MKAISIKQPWAWMIADGTKTIETRTWSTGYRGEILIVSSKGKMLGVTQRVFDVRYPEAPVVLYGQALAICRLVDCRPMTGDDEIAACCPIYPDAVSWMLEDIRKIEPFDVKGSLNIYEVEMPVDFDYELQERIAIMQVDNDIELHPVHLKNGAAKEIRERITNA